MTFRQDLIQTAARSYVRNPSDRVATYGYLAMLLEVLRPDLDSLSGIDDYQYAKSQLNMVARNYPNNPDKWAERVGDILERLVRTKRLEEKRVQAAVDEVNQAIRRGDPLPLLSVAGVLTPELYGVTRQTQPQRQPIRIDWYPQDEADLVEADLVEKYGEKMGRRPDLLNLVGRAHAFGMVPGASGLYVHVFNNPEKTPRTSADFERFMRIPGEISVSRYSEGEMLFSQSRYILAVLLEGEPRLTGEGDVWSVQDYRGHRYPTRSGSSTSRHNESFLSPSQSKLRALIIHPDHRMMRAYSKAAEALNVPLIAMTRPRREKAGEEIPDETLGLPPYRGLGAWEVAEDYDRRRGRRANPEESAGMSYKIEVRKNGAQCGEFGPYKRKSDADADAKALRQRGSDVQVSVVSNPGHQWIQEVQEEIEEDGTAGRFTAQARRAGYDSPMAFAQKIMHEWRAGRERVWNKREKRWQKVTTMTMRRANYLLNTRHRRNG